MKKTRNSNIELLRIIAALGVVVLHINGHVGEVLQKVEIWSIQGIILFFLEIVCSVAVNVFLLIFGYYQIENTKVRYRKVIYLLTTVIVYRCVLYMMEIVLGIEDYSLIYLISRVIPINYYVILYSVVYILSPYINLFLKILTKDTLKKFVLTIVLIFSVEAYFVDWMEGLTGFSFAGLSSVGIDGGQDGYTIVNFILMYIIGAYIRICEEDIKIKYSINMVYALQIFCWGALLGAKYITTIYGVEGSVLDYSNPILILSAVSSFMCFQYRKPTDNKIINELAKAAFTVYLTHALFIKILVKQIHIDSPIVIFECISISILAYLGGYILYKTVGKVVELIYKVEESFLELYREKKFLI